MTSTKREDVARVRDRLRDPASSNAWNREAADMLDALLDKRDALADRVRRIEEAAGPEELCEAHCPHGWTLKAERDAARAEAERLQAALRKVRDLGLGPDRGSAQWQVTCAREIARAALATKEPGA